MMELAGAYYSSHFDRNHREVSMRMYELVRDLSEQGIITYQLSQYGRIPLQK